MSVDESEFEGCLGAISLKDGSGTLWALEQLDTWVQLRELSADQRSNTVVKLSELIKELNAKGIFCQAWDVLRKLAHPASFDLALDLIAQRRQSFVYLEAHGTCPVLALVLALGLIGDLSEVFEEEKRSAELRWKALPLLLEKVHLYTVEVQLGPLSAALYALTGLAMHCEIAGTKKVPEGGLLTDLQSILAVAEGLLKFDPKEFPSGPPEIAADRPVAIRKRAAELKQAVRVSLREESY